MQIKNGALAPTAPACLNKARRYLFTLAPAAADLVLLFALGVLLWIA